MFRLEADHDSDMQAVAEAVESEEQWQMIAEGRPAGRAQANDAIDRGIQRVQSQVRIIMPGVGYSTCGA